MYSAMSPRTLHLISYEAAGSADKEVRLRMHGDDVFTLTPETVGSIVV